MTRAAAPAPTPDERASGTGAARIVALDAARAAAIVGMIAVNVGPRDSEGPLSLFYLLPAGRASLLFMLLAGIGMSILSRAARLPGGKTPWPAIVWRAALLVAGGLALQLLDHDVSVILPTYGFLFLVSLPLLRRSNKTLTVAAALFAAAGPFVWILAQTTTGETFEFIPPTLLDGPAGILHGIVLSGAYPAVVWAAPFVLGLLIGRADLRDRRLQKLFLAWGAAAAVGGYLLSRLLVVVAGEPAEEIGLDRLVSAVDHSQMPLWLISGTGSAVFVLGVFLLNERLVARRLGFLAATGRLSLTIYVGHLVLLAALVRPEPYTMVQGIVITTAIAVLAVVFASLWTRRFATGPLELLFRWPRRRPAR
ncbi:DUF418 domain-containing protein [Zhihengliuella halotolerans]|uniref:DUF418 domain-containing protein n=1 Tax=Zhihengliuella halotolerans TaxID=370736 RepID=UPI000C805978|nr:DUF418 domain-containing protein [Zhihengliuella halotolerans]